jgi:queuine tRNA-ribosyltransferase
VVRIRSGALAIRDIEAGEIMHPGVGPLVEAQKLYVNQARLGERLRDGGRAPLVLFDVGLGAGSNALAARIESERASPKTRRNLHILSFDRDTEALALALEHPGAFALDGMAGVAARAFVANGCHETSRTRWSLIRGDVLESLGKLGKTPGGPRADIVFWDPYSPAANPDLWTIAAFAALMRVAGPECTLFTYSASTAIRVALLLAGWAVGAGDGSGSKAETTAAAVRVTDLARPLDRKWARRLTRPTVPLPPDAPPDAINKALAAPQLA